jgi:hypothetical protein
LRLHLPRRSGQLPELAGPWPPQPACPRSDFVNRRGFFDDYCHYCHLVLTSFPVLRSFENAMELSQFILNLFSAALSAFLGVIIGLWYSERKSVKLIASEKQGLRRKLIKAFRFNIERLKQMHGQLTSQDRIVPDYRLDTESVSHVLFHGRDLFDDDAWFDKFNWQRFQLAHINAKVDFLNDITNLSGISFRYFFGFHIRSRCGGPPEICLFGSASSGFPKGDFRVDSRL